MLQSQLNSSSENAPPQRTVCRLIVKVPDANLHLSQEVIWEEPKYPFSLLALTALLQEKLLFQPLGTDTSQNNCFCAVMFYFWESVVLFPPPTEGKKEIKCLKEAKYFFTCISTM